MKQFILNLIGRLSLYIYPYQLSIFISTFFSYIASKRFKYLSHNHGQVFMERPFYILGHKYISYNSFYAHAGNVGINMKDMNIPLLFPLEIMFALILDVILGL